ncbi:hypothetical protein CTEN210_10375 [Chaetoceros tenuissimus]|uniref:Trichome birefringence-like C-terminal domain-containing protein n=1 Tax=Chaetoceros tenuissimus TaxID=426638 RepID=A0AAD3H8J1_9STRA|nr:hypothetical protein CTEN210_10375 [Chaetoceros tenuissimus]
MILTNRHIFINPQHERQANNKIQSSARTSVAGRSKGRSIFLVVAALIFVFNVGGQGRFKMKIDHQEIQREGNTSTTSNSNRDDAEKSADLPELDRKIQPELKKEVNKAPLKIHLKLEKIDPILVDEDTNSEKISELEFYTTIHNSEFPAEKAGEWIYRPDARANSPSKEHLHCLDQERQGNCHDPDAWKNSNDTAKLSRYNSMAAKAISNSPGILSGDDPWMWQSKLPQYRVLLFKDRNLYAKQVGEALHNRKIYLVGDSLTRQWSQSMRCELIHVLGMSPEDASEKVRYLQVHNGVEDIRDKAFDQTEERDVVVFNIGHHVGFKIGSNWTALYRKKLEKVLTFSFGNIADSNKFFRTTSVRHYIRGAGDWDTESSKAGRVEPSMREKWSKFGGSRPEQPIQNLIAFEVFLQNNSTRRFHILDTSPMMLARGDSTFDGCHFCLPGPLEYWSRMLYHRLYYSDT